MKQKTHIQTAARLFNSIDRADLRKFIRQGIMFERTAQSDIESFNIALFTANLNDMINGELGIEQGLDIFYEFEQREFVSIISHIHHSGTKNSWDIPLVLSLSRVQVALLEIGQTWYAEVEPSKLTA